MMFPWFTTQTPAVDEALTLSDVLTEEYEYLHKYDPRQRKIRFTIINSQSLVDKLTRERPQLLTVTVDKDEPKAETPFALPRSASPPNTHEKTPFTHLA